MSEVEVPPGLSTLEEQLYRYLVAHVTSEGALLDEYREVADRAGGYVGYLLRIIGEDEERHHRVCEQWASSIRGMATMEEVPDGVPNVLPGEIPPELVPTLRRLLDLEYDDAGELKRLERTIKDFREVTVWPLLVELMQLDTRKHQLILEFLLRHAEE
jgi:hypothetical protein